MNKNDLDKLTEYFVSDLYEDDENKNINQRNEIKENPIEKYKKMKKEEEK